MSTAKQRIIVLAGLVVLLIAAPILNYTLNNSKNKSPASSTKPKTTASAQSTGSVTTGNFFVDYISERNAKRADEVSYLDSIINDEKTDAATLKTAQEQKAAIAKSMEQELAVESLLKAKGFEEVAVIFQSGTVNVIVGKAELTDAEVAQILDVARTETGLKAENIKIIPVS